jgi:predicted unusual protein kinase regulating ubiquinone biosynthesis (AarF/ABC1/UbiB family)
MEYFPGVPIDDLSAIEAFGYNPRDYVVDLLRAWVLSGLLATVFHGDIHAGNLLVMPDGRLGMLDWGIVAQLDPDTHDFMRSLVEATLGEEAAWRRMSRGIMALQGDALQEGLGLNDAEIDTMVRAMLEPVLTLPVSQVSMSTLFSGGDEMVRLATGQAPPNRSLKERYQLNRRVAEMNKRAILSGFAESPFRRATFLAAKQLVYLERYARIYMPDRGILGDTEFLQTVIDRMPPRPNEGAA